VGTDKHSSRRGGTGQRGFAGQLGPVNIADMNQAAARTGREAFARRIGGLLIVAIFMPRAAAPATGADKPTTAGPVIEARDVVAIEREAGESGRGPYDWGPSVMRDGSLYKIWWVRLGGGNRRWFPYATALPSGERFEFTYPDHGDRIYYAESRDGRIWHLAGQEYSGPVERFGPDAPGPLMVLAPAESSQERMHVACPSVIKVEDTYYLYYEACGEFIVRQGPDGKPIVGDEYHNQVFVATSQDGRQWHKWPDGRNPQPIVPAPEGNRQPGRQRYGLGQPSVFYRDGRFIMHYVDSCTGPGDFIVRIEADNPFFQRARVFPRSLGTASGNRSIPAGAVARFAQVDVKCLDKAFYLLRPAYGTGNLGIMGTRTGLFERDAPATRPADVFPQIAIQDPRGDQYRERLYPRFLTDPQGEILVEDRQVVLFFTMGLGFKEQHQTWDLGRGEIPLEDLKKIEY
jgi:hypothetical protein